VSKRKRRIKIRKRIKSKIKSRSRIGRCGTYSGGDRS